MDVLKIFGERLKDLRIERDLSALKLGKLLDVDDFTIGRWEKGLSAISIVNLHKVALFFNTTPNYLLGFED